MRVGVRPDVVELAAFELRGRQRHRGARLGQSLPEEISAVDTLGEQAQAGALDGDADAGVGLPDHGGDDRRLGRHVKLRSGRESAGQIGAVGFARLDGMGAAEDIRWWIKCATQTSGGPTPHVA